MKKIIKTAGNLLTIAAVVFLVKKFMDMEADFSQLGKPPVIAAMVISGIIQTAVVIFGTVPWLVFTQSLSGKKIPFRTAMPVYTKSNIYKYVPGNVFQYIGRNQLAADMNISHVDVACATILDVFFCVLWTGIISVAVLGGKIAELLGKYGRNLLIIGGIGTAAFILAVIVVSLKFRDKITAYLSRYSKAFAKENRLTLSKGIFYYLMQNIVSAGMYFVSLKLVFGDTAELSELFTLTGAFMFAWIIGFVTPGAPGGIGIRESVMLFVCGEQYTDKVLLFVLAIRISSVIADISAFLIGRLFSVKENTASNDINS